MKDIEIKIKKYTDKVSAGTKLRAKLQGRLEAEEDSLEQLGFSSVEDAIKFVEEKETKISEMK